MLLKHTEGDVRIWISDQDCLLLVITFYLKIYRDCIKDLYFAGHLYYNVTATNSSA